MDAELKTAIEVSHLLGDDQRAKLIEAAPHFTPEQVKETLEILKDAETKYIELVRENNKKKQEVRDKYLADLKRIIPKVIKKLEEKEREKEMSEAETSLSELDNL